MKTPLDAMADFDLSPEQRGVRRAVRSFAEQELLPYVEEHERESRYPTKLIQKLVPPSSEAPAVALAEVRI
jgi:hypothetical protein